MCLNSWIGILWTSRIVKRIYISAKQGEYPLLKHYMVHLTYAVIDLKMDGPTKLFVRHILSRYYAHCHSEIPAGFTKELKGAFSARYEPSPGEIWLFNTV